MNDPELGDFGVPFLLGTGYDKMQLEFSNLCPLCGHGFIMGEKPNLEKCVHSFMSAKDMDGSVLCVHRCPVCKQLFVTRHVKHDGVKLLMQVSVWPETCVKCDSYIDDLKSFSPRFYELYVSGIKVQDFGLDAIVGNVFRMALECLVKDYAVRIKGLSESDCGGKTLYELINDCFGDRSDIKKCATFVRRVGNDATHVGHKYSMDDVRLMKECLDAICWCVHHEIKMENLLDKVDKID